MEAQNPSCSPAPRRWREDPLFYDPPDLLDAIPIEALPPPGDLEPVKLRRIVTPRHDDAAGARALVQIKVDHGSRDDTKIDDIQAGRGYSLHHRSGQRGRRMSNVPAHSHWTYGRIARPLPEERRHGPPDRFRNMLIQVPPYDPADVIFPKDSRIDPSHSLLVISQ